MKRFKFIALALTTTALLTACQTTQKGVNGDGSPAHRESPAVEQVAAGDIYKLEKAYLNNPESEQAAVNFAEALRKNDFLLRAATVLEPFAISQNASSLSQTEYAAIKLEQGDFETAEKYASRAVGQNQNNYEAWQYLGIALDAQEDHSGAEKAFRTALEKWEGDPTVIMNNLALNLASQEHLDEAEEILLKAKTIAPERREVERNLRIVRALKESSSYTWKPKFPPKPGHKP